MNYPQLITKYPPSMQAFIKTISNRLDANKNCLIPIVGSTGSGKSYASLSILIAMHEYRNGCLPSVDLAMELCTFKMSALMEQLDKPDVKKKVTRMWDESGIEISHKTHQSLMNRYVNYLIQTFRNLQQCILFSVPTLEFIDASVRKMFHYYLETKFIDFKTNLCVIKPLQIQYDNRQSKIYWHNFEYPNKNGYTEFIELLGVPIPPKEYREAYEIKANKFKADLITTIRNEVQSIENKKENNDNFKRNLPVLQRALLALQEKGIYSTNKQAELLGTTADNVSHTWALMQKKGIYRVKYMGKAKNLNILNQIISNAT